MRYHWQQMLLAGSSKVRVGGWRERGDPMQAVPGRIDRPAVHFEAPPAAKMPEEMERFVGWFKAAAPGGPKAIPQPPVRSALVHLYFASMHLFEDGNGRVGRALAEKGVSQI